MRCILKCFGISSNGYNGLVQRLKFGLSLTKALTEGQGNFKSKGDLIAGWLRDFALMHDPQPDRPYTILGKKKLMLLVMYLILFCSCFFLHSI